MFKNKLRKKVKIISILISERTTYKTLYLTLYLQNLYRDTYGRSRPWGRPPPERLLAPPTPCPLSRGQNEASPASPCGFPSAANQPLPLRGPTYRVPTYGSASGLEQPTTYIKKFCIN
jgi:hypothetical protein